MIIKSGDGTINSTDQDYERELTASTLTSTDDLPPYTPSSPSILSPSTQTSSSGLPSADAHPHPSSSSAMSDGVRRYAKVFILVDEHGQEYGRWPVDPQKHTRVVIESSNRGNSVSITTKPVPRSRDSETSHGTERDDDQDARGDRDGEGEGRREGEGEAAERDVRRSGRGRGRGSSGGRGRGLRRGRHGTGGRSIITPLEWFGARHRSSGRNADSGTSTCTSTSSEDDGDNDEHEEHSHAHGSRRQRSERGRSHRRGGYGGY